MGTSDGIAAPNSQDVKGVDKQRSVFVRLSQHIQRINIDRQLNSVGSLDSGHDASQDLVQGCGAGGLELEVEAKEGLETEHWGFGGAQEADFLARLLEPFQGQP